MTALEDARLALIGGGAMGAAIAAGLLNKGLVKPGQIVISEPLEARRDWLTQELAVETVADNATAVAQASVVLFAVKPQVLSRALTGLREALPGDALVLSIVAGATLTTLQEQLGASAIIRVMPNTPAQVGEGASVWVASAEVSESQRAMAREILGALGVQVEVDDEQYLDAATALSGSGPGYVFLFLEALTDAGVQVGFSRDVAYRLALQTIKGAAIYAEQSGQHPAVLRNQVTSPAGTTAAALYEFERGGLRGTVAAAVKAAYRRSIELGEGHK